MPVPIAVLDAFADRPFTGNPAAVCLLEEFPSADWMQNVAAEMRHAETAFIVPTRAGFSLRWFTPTVEVDLCGHATLASAQFLFDRGETETIRFQTRSGILTASKVGSDIELDFPAEPPVAATLPVDGFSLGVPARWTGRNRMDWFIEISSAEAVRALSPDFTRIAELGLRGLIVTAADTSGEYDFVSRCFYPQSGIDEDPVTGSAHCALAGYWAERLEKSSLTGYQASARGGRVGVELVGSRVRLRGHAVTVLKGTLEC